jgi:hypothetical protein
MIAETNDDEINASHTFGVYTKKMLKNDKKMNSSPICVRLMSVLGYSDNFELR